VGETSLGGEKKGEGKQLGSFAIAGKKEREKSHVKRAEPFLVTLRQRGGRRRKEEQMPAPRKKGGGEKGGGVLPTSLSFGGKGKKGRWTDWFQNGFTQKRKGGEKGRTPHSFANIMKGRRKGTAAPRGKGGGRKKKERGRPRCLPFIKGKREGNDPPHTNS